MAYLILFILIILPVGLYTLFNLKFGAEYHLATYYLCTLIIVLLITTGGHLYYYKYYALDIFPSKDYFRFILVSALIGIMVVVFLKLIFRPLERVSGSSLGGYITLYIILIVLFNWQFPLGYKYYYVKRLDTAQEMFLTGETNNVIQDAEIMIAFVESTYDPILRPRYRSPSTYDNYFFIKNNGSKTYRGNIFFIVYHEDNDTIDLKLLQNVEVVPNSTELLMERKNAITKDIWRQRTFDTKQKVKRFEAVIAQ